MASHGRRNREGSIFPVTIPSFFVIVLAQALEDGKLEIPRTVVRQCGDRLAQIILIKVSKGAGWGIELAKSNRNIWLQKGWPGFAKHYSLEHGSLLLFSSQGDYLHFGVQIFKRNTLEINYPPLEMNYPPNSSSTVEMKSICDIEQRFASGAQRKAEISKRPGASCSMIDQWPIDKL